MSTLRRVDPMASRGPIYRAWARLSGTRVMGWLSKHIGWKLDPVLMRLTGGRLGIALIIRTGLLETRGARTGRVRRNVLIYFHDGDRVTLVASHLGSARHPSWFYNLRAHPDVTFGGEPYRAVVVRDPAERERLWPLADRVFPPYEAYRAAAARSGRSVPLVQLERRL